MTALDLSDALSASRGVAPRILTIDIETSPNIAHVWGLWDQNVSLNQLRDVSTVISFAAKWYDRRAIEFRSDYHDGHVEMIKRAYALIGEADIVVHYNGTSFDMKHLHREFLLAGFPPPSPHKDVDLMLAVKANFRFASNKLDHVAQQLGLGNKTHHTGHQLWVDCLEGDEEAKAKAWRLMRRYNKQDTALTERLYDRIRPWIRNHPHLGMWTESAISCNKCGGTEFEESGRARTLLGAYPQYQCKTCGGWSRGNERLTSVVMRGIK